MHIAIWNKLYSGWEKNLFMDKKAIIDAHIWNVCKHWRTLARQCMWDTDMSWQGWKTSHLHTSCFNLTASLFKILTGKQVLKKVFCAGANNFLSCSIGGSWIIITYEFTKETSFQNTVWYAIVERSFSNWCFSKFPYTQKY